MVKVVITATKTIYTDAVNGTDLYREVVCKAFDSDNVPWQYDRDSAVPVDPVTADFVKESLPKKVFIVKP